MRFNQDCRECGERCVTSPVGHRHSWAWLDSDHPADPINPRPIRIIRLKPGRRLATLDLRV